MSTASRAPSAPPANAGQPPLEQFGNYVLLRKIGEGGMASVYLARSQNAPPDSPPIVVKRLHERLEQDRNAVDLFLTEADVTMMLDHPNVIRVYDCGEVGNRYFMTMEYVHGKDLEQIFDRLRAKNMAMHPDHAVHVMLELLKGLDYVHNATTPSGRPLGVVHRDVTPSNVYINTQGAVKLGDFGVAKLIGVEGWTMAGSLKGKLGYLAPEQIAGEQPSQTIDLWAACVIFYELLAGQRAFTGNVELDVMLRIKAGKLPRLRKVNKQAPKLLEKFLKKALHRKPHKRFATAKELLQELEHYRANHGRQLTPEQLIAELSQSLA